MLTVIGSLNYDLVTTAKRIPDGGETVHANGFATHFGGKGANEALALKRLSPAGQKVAIVGCVGTDSFGDELLEHLRSEGVDVAHVGRSEHRTGVATILVDGEGENRILVYSGANDAVHPSTVPASVWEQSDYILLQNEIPMETNISLLGTACAKGIKTVYNPSPMVELPKDLLGLVHYLVVNATEAAQIAGGSMPRTSDEAYPLLDKLLHRGVRSAVVITLGAQGAVFASSDSKNRGFVSSVKVDRVVDTTGAGDTFLAAFISKVSRGADVKESLEFAAAASAVVVTRHGAASSVPRLSELAK